MSYSTRKKKEGRRKNLPPYRPWGEGRRKNENAITAIVAAIKNVLTVLVVARAQS
ncbi:hypothetical protein [Microcoleus anatoxicus]|uniref:hypothetical protein n=1 Tax=Microcoleus anatoxicus TaxID=2705319 RepID=UPI0030C96FD2